MPKEDGMMGEVSLIQQSRGPDDGEKVQGANCPCMCEPHDLAFMALWNEYLGQDCV